MQTFYIHLVNMSRMTMCSESKIQMFTFRYRLYPSKKQQATLWTHANKLNWLYNYFLNQRIEGHKAGNKINQKQQQAELVSLKEQYPELKEIHSQVVQQVPLRLKTAYAKFFDNLKKERKTKKSGKQEKPGFPHFRSCRDFFGIRYPQSGFSIIGNVFKTKIYGEIKFLQHRPIKGNILQVYIKCIGNKWFLSITTDYIKDDAKVKGNVGIDLGLKNLVVASDGSKIKNLGAEHARYFDKQIDKLKSRKDSNCKKGSRQAKYLQQVVQRLYDAKGRKINDFQHKASFSLSRTYDTIYAEDLAVKRMSESKATGLNKAIRNAKLAQFLMFLEYKTRLVKVNPRNTSKTCNNCGHIHEELKLSERTIKCSECGKEYDRDENAAKNVYCLGQAIDCGLCIDSHDVGFLWNPWISGSLSL